MKNSTNVLVASLTIVIALSIASPVSAQEAEGGLYLTAFRSPATGVEYRMGRIAIHAGYYVTILKTDAQLKGDNTNFIRTGASFYLRPSGWTPYLSPSLLISLDNDWDNGVVTELGVRIPVFARAHIRGGVGVLTTFGGRTRVNPTIGLDVRLGAR